MKKIITMLLFCLFGQWLAAHNFDERSLPLKTWSVTQNGLPLQGSFYLFKEGQVFIENVEHQIFKYPLAAFSKADQKWIMQKEARIQALNQAIASPKNELNPSKSQIWIVLGFVICIIGLFFRFVPQNITGYALPFLALGIATVLYSFSPKNRQQQTTVQTNPAFIDAAFAPFRPEVNTSWDNTYFYVESKGIPTTHTMMTGITKWQQQVPIPQCYIGSNAWSIPLHPTIAPTPIPVNASHFLRGAVAVAANGIPIFNPYTNTGVDALLDGQLDNFGGHCGRADDYHYHIAPLHLYNHTTNTLPIAFALDGFAVYGSVEPDGSAMTPLDANHGHYGTDGVYHYHGSATAPYMIGNMVGTVTEDATLQIVPQAVAHPVRPALTPLTGATITSCVANANNDGYTLTYTRNGETYQVDYSWNNSGVYTFNFIAPTGTTTTTYNGFTQCNIPTAITALSSALTSIRIYPNPSSDVLKIDISDSKLQNMVEAVSIFDVNGKLLLTYPYFQSTINTDGLAKGMYFIKISLPKQEISHKFVVK